MTTACAKLSEAKAGLTGSVRMAPASATSSFARPLRSRPNNNATFSPAAARGPIRTPGHRSGKPGTHQPHTPALSENSSTSNEAVWVFGLAESRRHGIANVGFLPRGADAIATPPTRRGLAKRARATPAVFNPFRAAK